MKKIVTIFAAILMTASVFAQAPQKMSYQAVIRNSSNALVTSSAVGMKVSIFKGSAAGSPVFVETHTPTTNANGLASFEIGGGTAVTGTMAGIDWSAGPYFIKTETDPTGGTSYTITGTSQLMSVPYALFSANGTPGPAGPQGIQGLPGAAGTNGTNGATGATGPQGPIGLTGLTGAAGTNGAIGATGLTGATGPTGAAGTNGAIGATGLTGATGSQGPIGLTGPTGAAGTNGTNGAIGATGLTGATGPQGSIGLTGPAGAAGTNGTNGAIGATGLTGATGPQGPIGLTGATGSLSSGTTAGNTPYWDGSQWVVNNSNIHNNGAGIGIGTTSPNASAKVEIASATQGFLPPRMTALQRDAIASPATGLVIFNTTTNCLNFFIGSGWNETCGTVVVGTFPVGTVNCAGATAVINVTNPTTGKTWMDRNLGASQVATSSTDVASYGDLYQWGRRADGHQCRTSAPTGTLSSSDQPAHSNFIIAPSTPYDWRSPQNINLWQGVNGVNNPCPSGYRIPTEPELEAELLSWTANTSVGAFASPLKLPMAGYRSYSSGSLFNVGTFGFYWSSAVSGTSSRSLYFFSSNAGMSTDSRAYGFSVRCLKD